MQKTLNWTLPTLYTDGTTPFTPAEDASTAIFDAFNGGPSAQIGTVTGDVTTFETPDLAVGVHVFTVQITDTNGLVGVLSNAVSVDIQGVPGAPVLTVS